MLGGGSGVQYTANFAYITSTGDNTLSVSAVQADGTLAFRQSSVTLLAPFSLSLAPWGSNLLLASSGAPPNLDAYALSPVSGTPSTPPANFGSATTAGGVAIDSSEQWAFETDSTNAAVSTFQRIGANWAIGSNVTFPAGAGAGPLAISFRAFSLCCQSRGKFDFRISVFRYQPAAIRVHRLVRVSIQRWFPFRHWSKADRAYNGFQRCVSVCCL
jgi:hypothetical protein